MNGRFILIVGSAGARCPQDTLSIAIQFVCAFTREVLGRGGGVVVLAGDEARTRDDFGTPHIFDWVVLREVERYAERTTTPPRVCVRIVMSDQAEESLIDDENILVVRNLLQRNVAECHYIPHQLFTGGEYRKIQVEACDGVLAIAGGKGTYSIGSEMIDQGKPVLPTDLRLGSSREDGDGALLLHSEMTSDPESFFAHTHREAIHKVALTRLNRGVNSVDDAARAAVDMFHCEFEAYPQDGLWTKATEVLRMRAPPALVISAASVILKCIEFLRRSEN